MRPFIESARRPLLGPWIFEAIASPKIASIGKFLFWSFAFGISYTQSPLYTSNQNTKFIHGLADAGLGFLTEDWLANTIDVFPVFTSLVYMTYRYLHEYAFYFYNILIFGVYLYSLFGIVSTIYNIHTDRVRHLTFLTLIVALHSYAFDSVSLRLFGLELGQFLYYGVAEQHVIGRIFQPGVFGVFTLLSIDVFLRNKPFAAIFLLVLSATLHPAFFLSSAIFTCSYMVIIFKQNNNVKKSLAVGVFALILTLPALAYFYLQFSPTSPEIWSKTQDILVNFRSSHHMNADVWLNTSVLAKVGIVIVALYLVKRTKLLPIMLFPFLTLVLLTVAQMLTSNNTLAAATPWRLSVFLVPLSVGILVGHLVSYVFEKFREPISKNHKTITALSFAAVLLLVLYGVMTQVKRHVKYYRDDSIPMMNFVRETKSSGETYLVPVELEDFRLYTGAPTFITFKSAPFKDVEILEWYKRLGAASDFYAANNDVGCRMLKKLETDYRVTHVVVKGFRPDAGCGNLNELYRDDQYRIYQIKN